MPLFGATSDDRAEAFEIYCSDIVSWPANGNDLEETLESFEEAYQGYMEELSKIRKQSLLTSMLRIPECFRVHLKFLKDILTTKPSEEIYFLKATPKSMDLSLLIDKHPKL